MWVVDNFDDNKNEKIYAYNLSTKGHDASKDFDTLDAAGNDFPSGIWSDGQTMWVPDVGDKKLYAYRMTDKARDASRDFNTLIAAGNDDPRGIWSDETTMWVADVSIDKLYSYNMPLSGDATLSALTVSPKDIIGFAADRTSYEVGVASTVTQATVAATANHASAAVGYSGTDASSAAGHQVNLSAGQNTVTITVTAEDMNTTQEYTVNINQGVTTAYGWKAEDDLNGLIVAGNEEPRGIWSNGATIWVLDYTGNKLYAYRMSDGNRDASNDFNTLIDAGNTSPTDIWSDNTTMWVADYGEAKLFAYRMSDKARDSR